MNASDSNKVKWPDCWFFSFDWIPSIEMLFTGLVVAPKRVFFVFSFSRSFRETISWKKRSLKGLPGQTECLWFHVFQSNHKRTVMMTHSSRTFRPNFLRQHHRNESSNYPNHRCIGRRGRRDSQLALKHVFLIIEKRSDKRERKESKPFICWCSVTEIHAIMLHEIGKYCNETGYFVCARFVHGTFHFCTISIVIEVRLTSSHRTPSEQAIVESGNWRNARNVEWGGRTWMCT